MWKFLQFRSTWDPTFPGGRRGRPFWQVATRPCAPAVGAWVIIRDHWLDESSSLSGSKMMRRKICIILVAKFWFQGFYVEASHPSWLASLSSMFVKAWAWKERQSGNLELGIRWEFWKKIFCWDILTYDWDIFTGIFWLGYFDFFFVEGFFLIGIFWLMIVGLFDPLWVDILGVHSRVMKV